MQHMHALSSQWPRVKADQPWSAGCVVLKHAARTACYTHKGKLWLCAHCRILQHPDRTSIGCRDSPPMQLYSAEPLHLQGATLLLVGSVPQHPALSHAAWLTSSPALAASSTGALLTPVYCSPPQPAVAFANIGELAIDALVASLNLQRLAAADDPNVLPCVGNNPYTPQPAGSLATAMEVYGTSGGDGSSIWVVACCARFAPDEGPAAGRARCHVSRLCSQQMGAWLRQTSWVLLELLGFSGSVFCV